MKKRLIMFTTIVTLSLAMAACGSSSDTSSGDVVSLENEVNSSINTSTSTIVENVEDNVEDTNTTTYESVSIDPRIGKTLGELMDLTAYKEEAVTLDYFHDTARELKDVLPFEIYELIDGELINYYADDSGEKTVKAASIDGNYGSPMIIKMDDSDTFDMVVRATSDRYDAYSSCTYSSLPDFKIIEVNLTKEEVENMFDEFGMLKEEYRHLLQGSAKVSNIGLTLNEYISNKNSTPRYYLYNSFVGCLDELMDNNLEQILDNDIVLVYFGENPLPFPGDEIVVISTYFNQTISSKSLEEVIKTINGYKIRDIISLPEDLETIAPKYYLINPTPTPEDLNTLEVGKTLDKLIDLTAYKEIVNDIVEKDDYYRDLTNILPFEIYYVDYDETCKISNYAGAIIGDLESVMVVKMNNSSTYNILLRIPYESDGLFNSCSYKDLGNYRVIANNLTKEEVERMCCAGILDSPYAHLIYDTSETYNIYGQEPLGDLILRQMKEPKYLVFNLSTVSYEELTEENKYLLLETPMAYAYFGDNPMPQKNEKVTYVETHFDESIENISLENIIQAIKNYPILGTNELVDNPYDTSYHGTSY